MITFLGDIATFDGFIPKVIHAGDNRYVIANLEGAVVEHTNYPNVLFNNNAVEGLKKNGINAVSLANNHISDIVGGITDTIDILAKNQIKTFGTGNTVLTMVHQTIPVIIIAFGWEAISCYIDKKGCLGVNPLDYDTVIQSVKKIRETDRNSKIALMMHWDYELERYPMPLHRKLAFDAIDNGADIIIGSHPHCIQGIEFYRNRPIVYSVGNWYISRRCFFNQKLDFPAIADERLAIDWDPVSGTIVSHLYKYTTNNSELQYCGAIDPVNSETIKQLTPYSGFTQKEYFLWFKKNRRQKKFLPVYYSKSRFQIAVFNFYLKYRGYILKSLFKKLKTKKVDVYVE